MPCVSDASPDEQWPNGRLCDHPRRAVSGQFTHARCVEHFADFIECNRVKACAKERRHVEQIVQVSRAEQIILVSPHLVLAISKQPRRAPEKVLRNAGVVVPYRRSTLPVQKDGSRWRDSLEDLGFQLQGWKGVGRARAHVGPMEIQLSQITAAWNDRIVRVVGNKAKPPGADASFDRGELWTPQLQIRIQVPDSIAGPDFAKPADRIAQVNP